MCECAVNSAASGRAEGFPAPLLRSGLGERARGTGGGAGFGSCPAGVPRACLCVLDSKGKWLTALSLPLLPLPVLFGAE